MTAGAAGAGGTSVLVLSNLYPSTAFPGSGPFVKDQVRELARRNEIAVVSPLRLTPLRVETARRVLAVPRVSDEDGIRVVRPWFPGIPIGGISIEPRLWAFHLRGIMKTAFAGIGGELVHAHFGLPEGFVGADFASREHVPLVITLWGSDVLQLGRNRRARGLLRRSFSEARAIIAVSRELAQRAESLGALSERLRVIPGGVPYAEPVSRHEAREELDVEDDTLCILWVGGLVPVKQPLHAIEAFDALSRSSATERKLLLVMIGDGRLRTEVRGLVHQRRLERAVRLPGYCSRETVRLWQHAADVLVNSSETEGTPLAVLEALGAGTPVVGYPLDGVRAAVDAVEGGRVAAGRTPDALASALAAEICLHRDRDQLAVAARASYGIDKTCRAIEDVYRSVT